MKTQMFAVRVSNATVSGSQNEKGSLALEQILIIAAIVTMSAGMFIFYENISNYFRTFDISALPTSVSTSSPTASGTAH